MDKVIEERASFPDKPFKPFAVKMWSELFSMAEKFGDVAVCNNNGDASAISLSLRDSSICDSDYRAVSMADEPYVHVDVDGIDERLDAISDDDDEVRMLEELSAEVSAWMEKGIMEAFHSARIQKKYARYNPDGKRFSIMSDGYSDGVFGPDISLLWSHKKPRFTVAQLRKRQEAAHKKMIAARKAEKEAEKLAVAKTNPLAKTNRKELFSQSYAKASLIAWNTLFRFADTFYNVIRFDIFTQGRCIWAMAYSPLGKPYTIYCLMPPNVDNLIESEDERDEVSKQFVAWVEKGILEAFQSAEIQEQYAEYNPDGKNCAIVISKKEKKGSTINELATLDLSILWTNNPEFTVSRIKAQDKARVKKRD